MRWFKCLILFVGHILVQLSLVFITLSDEEQIKEEQKHFFKWFGVILGTGTLSVAFFTYLLVIPFFSCSKKSKLRSHLLIVFVSFIYFISLSVMLWGLQHVLIRSTVLQCYAVSGQIGLVFGLLVL